MTEAAYPVDVSVDFADAQLVATDIHYDYPGSPVLTNINLTLSAGDVLGLVGDNGVGKSTLLWILSGRLKPSAGRVTHQGTRVLRAQELEAPFDSTGRMLVEEALGPARRRLQALEDAANVMATTEDPEAAAQAERRYSEIFNDVMAHDAWSAEHNAEVVLDNLGLTGEGVSGHLLDQCTVDMSGGERARLGLALALIRAPEILLLDEPTNHLDARGRELVAKTIREHPGIVVLATHDRDFLDATCTHIGDIVRNREGIGIFTGNWTQYDKHRRHERQLWEHQWRTEEHQREHLETTIEKSAREVSPGRVRQDNDKLSYNLAGGRVEKQIARRVRAARQKLTELEENGVAKPPVLLGFNAPLAKAPSGRRVAAGSEEDFHLKLRGVIVPKRVHVGSLTIRPGETVIITGPNGSGKSSLLHVITGALQPEAGEVQVGQGATLSILEQVQRWEDPKKSAAELYSFVSGPHSLDLDDLGLITPEDAQRPVGDLSLGQQRRVALALLVANPPEILLMDEPTNHLSVDLIEEVQDAIKQCEGTIVVVTHDQRMIEQVEARHLVVKDGEVEELPRGVLPEIFD